MSKNRIAEYYPEAWKKYWDDDLERMRRELTASTGIDPLDFVANYAAKEWSAGQRITAENEKITRLVVADIIARSNAAEAERQQRLKE